MPATADQHTPYPDRPLNPSGLAVGLGETVGDLKTVAKILDAIGAACLSGEYEADGASLRFLAETLGGLVVDVDITQKMLAEQERAVFTSAQLALVL